MRRHRSRLTAAGVAAFATVLTLTGCVLDACPAIGYVDTSPIRLVFEGVPPTDATVSACFGSGCEPAPVTPAPDGSYAVPQRTPFLDHAASQPKTVRVVVTTKAEVLDDAVHDIPVNAERTGLWGQCPGPWSYQPVRILLD